ncbi:MAG: M56 family metallopeptidase, partial [Planctomycetaceae bacterium]
MDGLAFDLLWCAGQVTVVTVLTLGLAALLRRTDPSARAVMGVAGLALVLGLSALAFSPWPRWRMPDRESASTVPSDEVSRNADALHRLPFRPSVEPRRETANADSASRPTSAASQDLPGHADDDASAEPDQSSTTSAFLAALWDELRRTPVPEPAEPRRWPLFVAAVFSLAAVLGLGRLLGGAWAVARCRRRARPLTDAALLEQADLLRAELGCRAAIELRETDSLLTAATTGWRRPAILLSLRWREWTDEELRAVLAHEIAHVRRRDFPAVCLAQCVTVLHFYHPLVHWLARRLRLDQELAADALAASVTGGRDRYLRTLAEMALRQSDERLSWPATAFLPTRHTFLRRIEMLRDRRDVRGHRLAPVAAVGLMLLAGIITAGFRAPAWGDEPVNGIPVAQNPPADAESADAADRNPPAPALDDIAPLAYVPESAPLVITVRVADLLNQP